jgi:exopolysaccharide biosynthesis polyprenyl glycosylphosphotransferase
MLKEHKKSFRTFFQVFDIFIIIFSFCLAYYLRFGLDAFNAIDFRLQFKIFILSYLIVWFLFAFRFGLYSSKRFESFWSEARDIIKATSLCFLFAAIPAFFFRQEPLSRLFILYFWPIQTGFSIIFRFSVRRFLKYIRLRGYNFRQVLIVGRNQRAEKIAQKIKESPEFGIRIIGYIDDLNKKNGFKLLNNLNFLGPLENLEQILRNNVVDEVIITLPVKSFYSEIEDILILCEKVGVEVKLPTDLFSERLAKSSISNYHDIQVIDFYTSPKMNWQLVVKRLMDIIISTLLLVSLSPVALIVAILIKSTSKGPIHFRQQRIGYNGRIFTCLKFRTMVENAEYLKNDLQELNEMDGPVFKIKEDPRVTKVGRLLRKTSVDELPQLINVFKGDMSLVGPRPPIPFEVCDYRLQDRRRLSMRPGITCTWQVQGRNSISFNKWMELDREYIDNWSLLLDLKILVKTIPSVLRGSGAT